MNTMTGALVSSFVICTFNEDIQFRHAGWPPDVPVAAISADRTHRTPEHLRATPLDDGRWLVIFAIEDRDAQRMRLAGSFNKWNPNEGEMVKSPSGNWTLELELWDDTHLYKFVRNDGEWQPDPLNDFRAPDGHGGENTIIALGADALLNPNQASAGDGVIVGAALRHNPTDWRDLQPFGDQQFEISAQTLRNDVEQVWISFDDGHTQPMKPKGGSDLFDRWTTTLSPDREGHQYTFVFQDGELRVRHPDVYKLDQGSAPNVQTPDWAKMPFGTKSWWSGSVTDRMSTTMIRFVLGPSLGTSQARGKAKMGNLSTNILSSTDITAETCKGCKNNSPTSSLLG